MPEDTESLFEMVAAEVTRRTAARSGQEFRLVTSAATMPVEILNYLRLSYGKPAGKESQNLRQSPGVD